MGCAQSTEAAAPAAAATPKNTAVKAPTTQAPAEQAAPSKAPAAAAPRASDSRPPLAPPRPDEGGKMHKNEPIMVPLNGEAPSTPEGKRGRFASFASGASTPNSSSGDMSWSEEEGDSEKKSRKLKHSGSAIGLDEILNDTDALGTKIVHIEVPFGRPIEEVYNGVHDGPVLGSGVSGLVRLVEHKATGVKYAVKCLDLGLVGSKEGLAQLREEIFIMCQLDHPNIVRLEEVYESHSEIYLVQELCLGGELFDRLDEQPDYHYTEAECARLVKQMLSAVRYLHSKGIIHRDLKLENFLFSSMSPDSELKMIDFGLSKHFSFGEVHHEAVGTPYTVAPEVIRGSYDERCDIWAIGVITFLLLSGEPPFGGCGGPEPLLQVRANILQGQFEYEPEEIWSLVSLGAKEFIKTLLVIDPKQRPTAREAQKHKWLREWANRGRGANGNVLNPNVVKALVAFKEFSDMRKLLSEVLSFTLLPDQIKELRKEFEKMDTDGSGEISLAALKQVLMTNAEAGSLGSLTENEVEDIFNAMRVNKSETRIHWHEFVAAGLSQCKVDDRNLRLAFDRLDSDHKGYITLDDIMGLMNNGDAGHEDMMRKMWQESLKSVSCSTARITYDDFLLLMKGQTKEPPKSMKHDTKGPVAAPQTPPTMTDVMDNLIPERSSDSEISMQSLPNLGANERQGSSNSSIGITPTGRRSTSASPAGPKSIAELPVPEDKEAPPQELSSSPGSLPVQPVVGRQRSQSMEETSREEKPASFGKDPRRAVNFADKEIKKDSKSALIVNKQLYRAHRQMRLAVLEASRRFEENQVCRARDVLIAQKEAESGMHGAGLVMRHGSKEQVTTEAIREYLEKNKMERQELVEKINRRGGRGRSARKKTVSDMSAMMAGSLSQDEMGAISAEAAAPRTPNGDRSTAYFNQSMTGIALPKLTEDKTSDVHNMPPMIPALEPKKKDSVAVTVDRPNVRKATVPGEFRKTHDPFSSDGMYGGARVNADLVNEIKAAKKGL